MVETVCQSPPFELSSVHCTATAPAEVPEAQTTSAENPESDLPSCAIGSATATLFSLVVTASNEIACGATASPESATEETFALVKANVIVPAPVVALIDTLAIATAVTL